eukprot:scaffold30864_cov91-Isochrysis_galbana.AAC.3
MCAWNRAKPSGCRPGTASAAKYSLRLTNSATRFTSCSGTPKETAFSASVGGVAPGLRREGGTRLRQARGLGAGEKG